MCAGLILTIHVLYIQILMSATWEHIIVINTVQILKEDLIVLALFVAMNYTLMQPLASVVMIQKSHRKRVQLS